MKDKLVAGIGTIAVFALIFILFKSCNNPSPAPKSNYVKLTHQQRIDSINKARQIAINDSIYQAAEKHIQDSTARAEAKIARRKEIQDSLKEVRWERTRAGQIWKKHQDWDTSDCELIARNRIWIGMEYEMVLVERGLPNHVTTSNYGNGNEYQACWYDYGTSCFYFGEDHIITSYN